MNPHRSAKPSHRFPTVAAPMFPRQPEREAFDAQVFWTVIATGLLIDVLIIRAVWMLM